jgi:hypothetical protein
MLGFGKDVGDVPVVADVSVAAAELGRMQGIG